MAHHASDFEHGFQGKPGSLLIPALGTNLSGDLGENDSTRNYFLGERKLTPLSETGIKASRSQGQ